MHWTADYDKFVRFFASFVSEKFLFLGVDTTNELLKSSCFLSICVNYALVVFQNKVFCLSVVYEQQRSGGFY